VTQHAGGGQAAYRRGLVAACAIGMGASWNVANVGALAATVADHYGIALATVGLFTTVLFLAELGSMLSVGRLIDRLGPRRIGAVALALTIVGNAGTLLVDDLVPALALRTIVGVGAGSGFIAGTAYVSKLGGTALAQGMYGGVSLSAGGIAIALIPSLDGALGWRAPFITAVAASLIAAVALLFGPPTAANPGHVETPLRALLLDNRILRFAAVQSAAFGLGIVLSNWVVTILERRGGVSDETAGAIGALIFIMGIVARPLGGLFATRRPDRARALFACGMLVGAAGTLLIGFARPISVAVAGAVLLGIATGLPFGATVTGLARAFPGAPGTAFAVANVYAIALIVVGTPLVGLTFSLPGDGLIGFVAAAALWTLTVAALPHTESLSEAPKATA
jgi:MFS family permease